MPTTSCGATAAPTTRPRSTVRPSPAASETATPSSPTPTTTGAVEGSIDQPLPTRAVRLANGHTLISDQFNDQVIEVNHEGQIVFSQGHIQADGAGFNQLNAPYDAKVIGDYTGLTPPPEG